MKGDSLQVRPITPATRCRISSATSASGGTSRRRRLLKAKADANRSRLRDVVAYCDHFIDRYAGDFERLVAEMPSGVRPRHLETVKQLYQSALGQLDSCIDFKRSEIEHTLPDESMRPLLDGIYRETRGSIEDYRDLSNLAHRLKAFVDEVPDVT